MTDSSPETPSIFTIEPEYILDINSVLKEERGQTLEEIADEDPLEAYKIVRRALLLISQDVGRASERGRLIATAEADGAQVPIGIAAQSVERALPDPIVEPIAVELRMWDVPEGDGPEHRTHDRASHLVVKFTAEPPSLA